ncbi:glycoside hydrolase family 16 protein [Amniculicola lignicola CBS 123094]|uniref:chitinase n=1 Tax=Amniculicola lignicola CBS 123094 TaxID=1392246 RepID=A0A6A5WSP1_9PLEO|nr:glycoside hydrolase family 16 protein [Amniculicola lignicola CBS 123094]
MRFGSYLAASAVAALASAQTFTECDPTKKECPNNPAMSKNFETDFKAGKDAVKGWKQTAGSLNYGADGAEFTITKRGEAPTIQSETYLFFGYVEVKCKAAVGQGIVSSIVLQSEDLDEVDWEFIGNKQTRVEMNYFGKGNTSAYDRMMPADVTSPMTEIHSYALNWTSESLTWLIDDKPIRTLNYADAVGGKNYPQTPSTVRIGIWAGGDEDNTPGTIEWAGGKTDYSKAPFTMTVESVKVINYNPGTEYKWTDKTGDYGSIEVIGAGKEEGAPQNSAPIASASVSATGGGLGSEIDVPTQTGGQFNEQPSATNGEQTPVETTPCSEGEKSTEAPIPTPYPTGPTYENGTSHETPCSCGVATVTITGPPPSDETPIPSEETPVSSPVPVPSESAEVPPPVYDTSALPVESESSAAAVPPAVPTTAPVSPPYPITTGGIMTDTAPAPTGNYPTATGSVPSSTVTGLTDFTGAASLHKAAGAMAGVVAGAVMWAL